MTEDTPAERTARQRRLWLTVGEVVAVAGLALGALNYWESHNARTLAEREKAQAEAAQKAAATKAPVFVMRGSVDGEGERVMLEALRPDQVIQSQRYLFPKAVLNHPMEIQAGRPQIQLDWFDGGLKSWLKSARKAGAPLPEGEAELPVGVVTTYVDGGEMVTDRSLYRIGYVANSGLLGAVKLHLQGISLVRRDVKGDLQKAVDAMLPAPPPRKS